ncbi:MAG: DNA repair protein RadA [Deltaproteobacteria bacterium]|nr:DNA repair protein RadA [Deltaproteobacteria bacterium]
MKKKTVFVCAECGYNTQKWLGQCPSCSQWNTLHEEIQEKTPAVHQDLVFQQEQPRHLSNISSENSPRYQIKMAELDRVLGGGLVQGSLTLIGGEPGIGKSTLLLQMMNHLSSQKLKVFYISAEESLNQLKLRADRLGASQKSLFVLSETNLERIMDQTQKMSPHVLVVDSIQTIFSSELESAPGTVAQIRHCAARLMYLAKKNNISTILVGHVTKEGSLAGPRVLEHLVDTVLYFDNDASLSFRILRATKNRFGSTHEIGIFEMSEVGLLEIHNASEFFLSERAQNQVAGTAVVASIEGTRPFLVEIQSLVSASHLASPRRTALGIDPTRVSLLLAVLQKAVGVEFSTQDVYVNVAGGLKIQERAVDLGIMLSALSSFRNAPLQHNICVIGEVGLTGELRPVRSIESRIQEATKLGFTKCLIPLKNMKKLKTTNKIEVLGVSHIREAVEILF